ncbi:MAG: metallophosphoesterase [Chloroflexi bacterium]|uniref:Metallophosphoesterase n=1 Tax=Candidatus Chlorohelix allophototropha TaxID=3003348 RepID=A0A8T7M9S5_9CHLR|nr:metallophosphoesterase [Chloroflexota bacterium]NWJ49170.1 metallophosphoesterase [Chloroflexota bacterium]WJW68811.1 metallophosphoesterase [Chloroflexota bacterium L227-S17]
MSQNNMNRNTRRRFLKKAAGLAFGGLSLGWLSACGEVATPIPPTPLPTAIPTSVVPTTTVATSQSVAATTTVALPIASPTPAFQRFGFIVYGDIRTAGLKPPPIFDKLLALSKEYKPQAALLVGDIINAEDNNSVVKTQWEGHLKPFAALGNIPILPTIGNHETNYRKAATPLYLEAFPDLPKNGPADFKGYAYSLDIGAVHFVSVASELPSQPHQLGKVQLAWLEQDLKATRQPYILVMSHDPAYPAGPHVGNSLDAYPAERDAFWKLLMDNNVTAYITGHEHLYNKSVRNGIYQLIIGTSGSYPYSGWSGDFYHFASFDVTQQAMNVQIIDETGKERDKLTLKPR